MALELEVMKKALSPRVGQVEVAFELLLVLVSNKRPGLLLLVEQVLELARGLDRQLPLTFLLCGKGVHLRMIPRISVNP
jgi:hypothetical protein